MQEMQRKIIELFKEEHQDWVKHIKDAEETGEGIDLNLGGNFAERIEGLMTTFREFEERLKPKRKRMF